jgi:hypothetical protein
LEENFEFNLEENFEVMGVVSPPSGERFESSFTGSGEGGIEG